MKQNRLVKSLLCLLAVVFMAGCIIAPVVPPTGAIFNNTRAPLDVDFEKTEYGSKTGAANTNCILGLIAWGDASAEAAAKNGDITTIEYVDYEYMNVLYIYQRFTTIAHGK